VDVVEDLLDDVGIGDEGEHDHGCAAVGAQEPIDVKNPFEKLRPTQMARSDGRRGKIAGGRVDGG
jgi:hypothetical protein